MLEEYFCFRKVDDSGMCLLEEVSLGMSQHPLAERLEVGASVGLPLQQFQSMHLNFDLIVAPAERQPSFDGIIVLA